MEFKTKAALTEWANDQTMAEIAAYYNGLPGVKPVKKLESRDVAVTRIWAVLSAEPADKPKMAWKPEAGRKSATSGRKLGKTGVKRAERPTRLRVWRGESPRAVNCLFRTASISGACGGNKA